MAGVAGGTYPNRKLTPVDEFQRILLELLLQRELDTDHKKKYGKFFIEKSNDEFIEDIPYDFITKIIYAYNIYDTQVLETIFDELETYIDIDEESDETQKKFANSCLKKIIRHIRLALVQNEFIGEKQGEVSRLTWDLQEARNSLEELSKDLDKKVLETEKNIHINQMSVLGVFAGVVTAFIGGFGVTMNIFSNLVNKVPIPKIIAIASLLFIGIACVIYLLLAMSSRVFKEEGTDEGGKRTFYRIVRILALMCLGAALIYQLQFSKENPIFTQQGIWYTNVFKWGEIIITAVMIGLVIFPLPIFKIKNWVNRKWGN
jgi:hypothetical protein